jgi:asparagine synthase (glutamine-hydrolysing)
MKIWLPGDILTKLDRTSMATSLEAREPLLDHRLIEFAATLPASLRIRRGEGKWLMKKAMERHLPHEILYRKKMGFVTPVSAWFRGPLAGQAEALVSRSTLVETGWFRPETLKKIVAQHKSGLADNGRAIWQLVMLESALNRLF